MTSNSRTDRLRLSTRHPALRGIAIGHCVDGREIAWDDAILGHAHRSGDARPGWICFGSLKYLNPTNVTHELAHLISNEAGHGERWKRTVRELGGRVERRYL